MSNPDTFALVPLRGRQGVRGYAKVDPRDAEDINRFRWYLSPYGYASRRHSGRTVLMHRQLLNAPVGTEVDHINGDRLDNRCSNLRLCTRNQNFANRQPYTGTKSVYKGVSRSSARSVRWRAYIKWEGRRTNLGSFATEEEAARAYDKAARRLFGEFARPNFPTR